MNKDIGSGIARKPRAENAGGFTLVEMMVVLMIIGLLISIVGPKLMGQADDARIKKMHADFKAIETALKMYRLDNYTYPSSEQGLEALVEKPSIDPQPRNWRESGYLEKVPKDPFGNPYRFLSPGEHGDFDLYSLGMDNVSGGEGANADIGNWDIDEVLGNKDS